MKPVALLGLLLAAFAGSMTPAVADEPMTKLTVAYDGFSMSTGPLYYGYKTGIFKRFGLDFTPVFIDGGTTLSQAVVGGSVDIAQNGYTPAMAAAVQGADIVIIGGISNKLPMQLVVKSAITDAQQLKGQSIAISKFGSSTDTALDFALNHLGMKRTDITVLQLGGAGTRVAADLSGRIAGSVEQYPDTEEVVEHGFHVLVDVTDIATDYPNTAYVTTRAYLKAHPDTVKRFFMAQSTAIHEFKTHPDQAIALSAELLHIKNEKAVTAAYEVYKKVYPDIPLPSLPGMALVLKELATTLPAAATMKPAQMVDTSTLDELQREGFFTKLFAENK